jgi:hypothetical protein
MSKEEKKHIVLSTIVERELYEKVLNHCQNNSLTPSSLIRDLLIQEINGRQSLTSIYNDIKTIYNEMVKWLKTLQKQNLEILENVLHTQLINAIWMKTWFEERILTYKGHIPSDKLEELKEIDGYIENLKGDLERIRQAKENVKET